MVDLWLKDLTPDGKKQLNPTTDNFDLLFFDAGEFGRSHWAQKRILYNVSPEILIGRRLGELEIKVVDELKIQNSPIKNEIPPKKLFDSGVPLNKYNYYIVFKTFFENPSTVEIFVPKYRENKKILVY